MTALPHDRHDNFRAPLDPYGAVTHEVFNQPVELADYNLFDSDAALKEAVRREGADWAATVARRVRGAGRLGGLLWSWARSPTRTRLNSTPTTAMGGASIWCDSIRPITR